MFRSGSASILVRTARTWCYSRRLRFVSPAAMPSLFRFLAAVGIIIAVIYGSMIALTVLVQPQSREISVTIPQDRFSKQK